MNVPLSIHYQLGSLLAGLVLLAGCQQEPAPPGETAAADAPSLTTGTIPAVTVTARNNLASRLGVQADDVKILESRSVYWRNAALGCPDPERSYAQVLTPGWLIRLAVGQTEYRYHAGQDGAPFPCNPRRAQAPIDYAVD